MRNIYKINENIYITDDEEIKDGDCFTGIKVEEDSDDNSFVIVTPINKHLYRGSGTFVWVKKIILTTDQDLIKDGVQAIDDEFLEWFVNNPSYEDIEVLKCPIEGLYTLILKEEETKCYCGHTTTCDCGPEEPKQETLEEAAEREYPTIHEQYQYDAFIEGAKWQQEQIIDFLHSEIIERRDYSSSKMCEKVIEFIEQFKKK